MSLNWGWRIAIVYTIFAVSTLSFVGFAMSEHVELVRKDYYEASLLHDKTFSALERGDRARDVVVVLSEASLDISLPDGASAATATLYRPENSQLDRLYDLTSAKSSVLRSELRPGRYEVTVKWQQNAEDYLVRRSITIE